MSCRKSNVNAFEILFLLSNSIMNLHVFSIYIIVMLLTPYNYLKSLPESEDQNSEMQEFEDSTDSVHNTKKPLHFNIDNDYTVKKNEKLENDKRKQCAIMFNKNEPIGVLEPYKEHYKFLPLNPKEKIPVEITLAEKTKRDLSSIKTDSNFDNNRNNENNLNKIASSTNPNAKYNHYEEHDSGSSSNTDTDKHKSIASDKYPFIYAKYMADSRMANPLQSLSGKKHRNQHKTIRLDKKEEMNSKPSHDDREQQDDNLEHLKKDENKAEDDLRDILSDMGLVDDNDDDDIDHNIDKRNFKLNEDEDLEYGTNKIDLIQVASNDEDREKREEEVDEEEKIRNDHRMQKQREIEEKIKKRLKEKLKKVEAKLKREIEDYEDIDFDDEIDGDEENIDETQRKKRNIMETLIDRETSDIDPIGNSEDLVPHIRRRRETNNPDQTCNANNLAVFHKRKLKSYEEEDDDEDDHVEDEEYIDQEEDASSMPQNSDEKDNSDSYYEDNESIANKDNEQNDKIINQHNDMIKENSCKCSKDNPNCKCKIKQSNTNNPLKSSEANNKNGCKCNKDDSTCKCINTSERVENKIKEKKSSKIDLTNGDFYVDLNPDRYEIVNRNVWQSIVKNSKKPNIFDQLVSKNNKIPIINHLMAIRRRSMLPPGLRIKRMIRTNNQMEQNNKQLLKLEHMSDEDLFGSLPQRFEGEELNRYKRVKRTKR